MTASVVAGAPLRGVLAQARMELVLMVRSGESLLVTVAIPVGILVFFSRVEVIDLGVHPVETLVPGVLSLAVMSSAFVALAIQTGFQRSYGVLKRLGGTPLSRAGLLASKAAAVLAVVAAQTALVVVVALALGWQPATGAAGTASAAIAIVVGTFSFAALGLLIAGTLRAEATLAVTNGCYLALLVVSGVVFPLASLPSGLAAVGRALPAGALNEALRMALHGSPFPGRQLVILTGWGVAAATIAAIRFRWEP